MMQRFNVIGMNFAS